MAGNPAAEKQSDEKPAKRKTRGKHAQRVAVRRAAALQLRLQGGTYRQIADQLKADPKTQPFVSVKYDHTQAWKDVQEELDRLNDENAERADRLRSLTHERLNALLTKYWPLAARGDYAALDRVLAIMDRIARLYGVDKLAGPNVTVGGEVALSGNIAVEQQIASVHIYIPDNGRDTQPAAQPGE